MESALYDAFVTQHPACTRLITNLRHIEDAIPPQCFTTFFEPVAHLANAESSPRLIGELAPYLDAWTCHIAYGTTARLRGLTGPFLQQLLEKRLSVACILQRAIMEHAGRAAFALCRLTECSKNDSWDELRVLIPKTLFGTSLTDVDGTELRHPKMN
jgi:hypothetical protein